MNRLLEIGFEPAGHWLFNDDVLVFELTRHASQRNILYAFVCDGEVKYVGKTTQSLRDRLNGYKYPSGTQPTNIKNNANIKALLQTGAAVDILALPDNGLFHYGQFHLNLAAGLEDNIISVLRPEWNGGKRSLGSDEEIVPQPDPDPVTTFPLVLQQTYFNTGFFNVGTGFAGYFGGDSEEIEIYCGSADQPIIGSINRRGNTNNTPRIMGGRGLRDWFQQNMSVMQNAKVSVLSRNAIRIESP